MEHPWMTFWAFVWFVFVMGQVLVVFAERGRK